MCSWANLYFCPLLIPTPKQSNINFGFYLTIIEASDLSLQSEVVSNLPHNWAKISKNQIRDSRDRHELMRQKVQYDVSNAFKLDIVHLGYMFTISKI